MLLFWQIIIIENFLYEIGQFITYANFISTIIIEKSIEDMKFAYVINMTYFEQKNFDGNIREIKTYWTWIKPSILRKNIKWLKCKYYYKTMVTELIKIFFHIKINLQSETKVAQS